MSTCDETSVKSIVDREETTKRRRKKPARFNDSSSSDRDSDEDENTNNKNDKDKELDGSEKAKLPSFNYNGGHEINAVEPQSDGDFETQKLDYGNYFDDPPHPKYKQSEVTSKPIVRQVEAVQIPGENEYPKNPENKPTTSHVVRLRYNVTNPNLPDDDQNAAGFSSTKGSFTTPSTPRAPSLPRTVDSIVPVSRSTVQSLKSHNCCSACHSILNSISRKLDALLNIHANNPQPTTTHQANVLPNFPISSYEDLKKFNQSLIDKEAART